MSSDLPALLGGRPVLSSGPPTWPISNGAIAEVFRELAASGDWGRYQAGHTAELIACLQNLFGVQHVILTSSGTVAVELALRGLRVGQGDEVVQAAYDFKANFTNISLLGAGPVLVDIQAADAQLDVDQIERAISSETKVILASHLHGGMVDMARLRQLAEQHNLSILEDCCQVSPFAKIGEQPVGGLSDAVVLSFGGSKLLSAGRGGAVLTNRDDVAQRIRLYMQRGNDAYPLSEMQAAVLIPQLEELESRHQSRCAAAEVIRDILKQEHGLVPLSLRPDTTADYYKLGFWYVPEVFNGLDRASFCRAMRAEGVSIDPGFAALHLSHARRRFRSGGELKHATHAHDQLVILHHPLLLSGKKSAELMAQALDKIKKHATILRQLPG